MSQRVLLLPTESLKMLYSDDFRGRSIVRAIDDARKPTHTQCTCTCKAINQIHYSVLFA